MRSNETSVSAREQAGKRYEHFLSSGQEKLRLSDALEGYFCADTPSEHIEHYRSYLLHHLRPALDQLALSCRDDRILLLKQDGLVEDTELELLITRMADAASPLQWQHLIRLKYPSAAGWHEGRSDAGTGPVRSCLSRLYSAFPFLDGAISALSLTEMEAPSSSALPAASDGIHLFFDPRGFEHLYLEDPALARRTLFHLILHCLLGHLWKDPQKGSFFLPARPEAEALVNAAKDIHVEFLIERSCRKSAAIRQLLGGLPIPGNWTGLYDRMQGRIWSPKRILQEVPEKTLLLLAPVCARDDHTLWPSDDALRSRWSLLGQNVFWQEHSRDGDSSSRDNSPVPGAGRSGAAQGQGTLADGGADFGIGASPGTDSLPMGMIARGTYDYRSFLHRFAVFREEMEPDPCSFDLIYYTLGMERYGDLPLIEPLETREGYRLEQLVIAIDTSGSCKTPTVRRFLEETRSILEEKENFFRRMNVWILQCDCIVQDAVNIRSREDWDAYLRTLKITGRSGTDFRPVFTFVEKLRSEGRLPDLKALIYFTDGDGVFPREAPDYETAFVFVEEPEEGLHTPPWATRLLIPDDYHRSV